MVTLVLVLAGVLQCYAFRNERSVIPAGSSVAAKVPGIFHHIEWTTELEKARQCCEPATTVLLLSVQLLQQLLHQQQRTSRLQGRGVFFLLTTISITRGFKMRIIGGP